MNTKPTLRWDDVVFENRNKMYGAYTIRQSYHSNLSRGTVAAFALFSVVFIGGQLLMNLNHNSSILPKVIGGKFPTVPPLVIPEAKPQQVLSKPPASTNTNLPPRLVKQEIETPPIQPTVEMNTDVENATISGVPVETTRTELPTMPAIVEPPATVDFADVMPEFEAGVKALYKFLRKNLHYPSVAQRMGLEGTVYVRFVVDTEGSVTNIEVMRGITGVLDKEASRVISLLPKWKPGRQHNKLVNVRMMLPIKFELGE